MTEMAPLARVNVGGVTAENPLWLAPLAEISMPPVRALFRRMGVGLTHTEMVSSSGLCHGNRATLGMLPREGERPSVLQLFGDEAEEMGRSLEIALFRGVTPQAVQINMACPVRKVFRRGEGARLLERPEVAEAMIRTLVPFGLPVWAKIRLAGRGCPLSTEAFCEVLFAAGTSCVALHGRTAAQMYEGTGDRDAVGALARAFPGSIVGSGDVYTAEDVRDYLARGCAAVLLARGGVRDIYSVPRILGDLGYPVAPELLDPTPAQRVETLLALADHMAEEEGERGAMILLRRFLSGIFKGLPGAAFLRRSISTVTDRPSLEAVVRQWEQVLLEGGTNHGGSGTFAD